VEERERMYGKRGRGNNGGEDMKNEGWKEWIIIEGKDEDGSRRKRKESIEGSIEGIDRRNRWAERRRARVRERETEGVRLK
jgi:hypothetical protein